MEVIEKEETGKREFLHAELNFIDWKFQNQYQ